MNSSHRNLNSHNLLSLLYHDYKRCRHKCRMNSGPHLTLISMSNIKTSPPQKTKKTKTKLYLDCVNFSIVLTSCVWLSSSSRSLGDSGDLHAVKSGCPVQVSRLRLEWPRAVREKVTVRALRFPCTNASSPRTSKHTLPNTSSVQFMIVWQIESCKFQVPQMMRAGGGVSATVRVSTPSMCLKAKWAAYLNSISFRVSMMDT